MLAVLATVMLATAPLALRPIELSVGGDDGLTQHLADEVRAEIAHRDRLRSVTGKPINLEIVENVSWRDVQDRIEIRYRVSIEAGTKNKLLKGKCWEDEMKVCAVRIVDFADRVRSSP